MIAYGATFGETLMAMGGRARQLRLARQLRQSELAAHAGVGIATVRRFEKTGSASIENVLRIATALNSEAPFDNLFHPPAYASLDDVLSRVKVARRRRAPRRK